MRLFTKQIFIILSVLILMPIGFMRGATIFRETFESGTLNGWNVLSGASSLSISTAQNRTASGAFSAQINSSLNRMYHNLGTEVSGHARITFWLYDGSLFQALGEVRAYAGSGYDSNGANLQQLFAIGKYTTTTMPGEFFDGTKYQARVLSPSSIGWFNLNASTAPNRSPGWHKFEIERMPDGTTINFYVDGNLGRQITGAISTTWDSVVIGSIGATGTTGNAWIDDVQVSSFLPGLNLWSSQNGGNGHYYEVVNKNSNITWSEARNNAMERGGYLATITSQAENDFVTSLLPQNSLNWIGGLKRTTNPDLTADWEWITGEPMVYQNWTSGAPNPWGEYYIQILGKEQVEVGHWNDGWDNTTPWTTVLDYVVEYGTPGAINIGEPIITIQPKSQFVAATANATFTVSALSASPVTYQWLHDGAAIVGATGSTLMISNAQQTDAGWYFAVVSNPLGSARSQDASLGVFAEPPNGAMLKYVSVPSKQEGKDSFIVATHGWKPFGGDDLPWLDTMTSLIAASVPPNWQVMAYKWSGDARPLPDDAISHGSTHGTRLGRQIAAQNWAFVHLIGHSAGAALIQAAAEAIKLNSSSTIVHTTFLDPYIGIDLAGRDNYGKGSDWSDNYFSDDSWDQLESTFLIPSLTQGSLVHAYNVDVSWLDPNHRRRDIYCSSLSSFPSPEYLEPCGSQPISSHSWPHDFYTKTIPPNTLAKSEGFGFPLSKEGGNWNYATSQYSQPNDPPYVLDASKRLPQNRRTIFSALKVSPQNTPNVFEGMVQLMPNGFSAATAFPSFPQRYVTNATANATDSSTWLSLGISVSNTINFLKFDAQFTSQTNAAGLLTVYWNTNQIGLIDEAFASPGLQSYLFVLPDIYTNGNYTLAFRIDPFTNIVSSISVTNIAFGFSGQTNSIALSIEKDVASEKNLLTLTGSAGYSYLVQDSTDLVNWNSSIYLLNTNGTV